ncbi:MAG: NAD(P)-dependent glycerol-3-phosphate dehydrogenase [Proteobacteria bacterium]|jgi:glycerol-3-phosphate dehydrogenase (NAD(P)+)|nr:NAD(P)-dependent glycerol-3-phosphate dehydrogenase [Pseudomonadota bacterium]MDA1237457.1 NAD(P)-dependent glycerol-3-phosphate dehydrogenase [Pseudomonadota bacterium]
MTRILISGAGAFGTALSLVLNKAGKDVTLIARNSNDINSRQVSSYLPNIEIPSSLKIVDHVAMTPEDILLLAIPMQNLKEYMTSLDKTPKVIIACCKGIELGTGKGPTEIIRDRIGSKSAILTGPSFALDIAKGLPAALTLATTHEDLGLELQKQLSTETIRLYLSPDPVGAELGGALKNVIAIACGMCLGAGFGESARAALMTRGFTEMVRLAVKMGAKQETLNGLSGFGDLVLTCTSSKSRNFSFGFSLGANLSWSPETTVEGRATAKAVLGLSDAYKLEMPITNAVAKIIDGTVSVKETLNELLKRPLKNE